MEKILTELRQMRLPGMAQTWQNLMETRQASSLNVIDGLRLLLQGEHDMRRANRNDRLLKNARFRYQVSVDELAYDSARGLDRAYITQPGAGEYIRRGIPANSYPKPPLLRVIWFPTANLQKKDAESQNHLLSPAGGNSEFFC